MTNKWKLEAKKYCDLGDTKDDNWVDAPNGFWETWDSNEKAKFDRAKLNHTAKYKLKEEAPEFVKTLESDGISPYKYFQESPAINSLFYLWDSINVSTLERLYREGKNPNTKKYPFIDDKGIFLTGELDSEGKVKTPSMLSVLRKEMAALKPYESVVLSDGFKIPAVHDETKLSVIDTLLSSVGAPRYSEIGEKFKESLDKISEFKKTMEDEKASKIKSEEEVSRLTKALAELSVTAMMTNTEKEVIADGPIPSGKMVFKNASECFRGVTLEKDFKVPFFEWDGPHPNVPKIDKHYVFRPNLLIRVLYALVTNQRAYLQGHTGSGKTTLIEQVAAHLNYPFIRVNFDSEIQRSDLIGQHKLSVDTVHDKTISEFQDGILPKAMASPCIFCADEIDFVRPDVAYVMQAALEGNSLRIMEDGDRVVKPDDNFRMFATGNTVGQGDEEGMYQGARPQSLAFLDRFTVWIKVDYLNGSQRKDLLERHFPTLNEKDKKSILQYITEHLEAFRSGKVLQPISPRGMLAIAKATIVIDLKEALYMTVLDRANKDSYAVLVGIVDRVTR